MKKELKIVIGMIALIVIGFVSANVIFSRSQTKQLPNALSLNLPEQLVRSNSYAKGKLDSSTTLIEFLDPECESCAAFYPMVKDLLRDYEGKIRFVVRYMAFHKSSVIAIAATEAAGMQGKYWEMQELLFARAHEWSHRDSPDPEIFKSFASDLGLNREKFDADLKNPVWSEKAQRDMADGQTLGVQGTPSFFVNQNPVAELSIEALRSAIESSLSSGEK